MMADDNVYLGCYNELADAGVEILTDTKVLYIMDDGIIIINKDNQKSTLEADTIVLAAGLKPDNGLAETLQDQAPE